MNGPAEQDGLLIGPPVFTGGKSVGDAEPQKVIWNLKAADGIVGKPVAVPISLTANWLIILPNRSLVIQASAERGFDEIGERNLLLGRGADGSRLKTNTVPETIAFLVRSLEAEPVAAVATVDETALGRAGKVTAFDRLVTVFARIEFAIAASLRSLTSISWCPHPAIGAATSGLRVDGLRIGLFIQRITSPRLI